MAMEQYTTIARRGDGEYIEKRSRFIGVAAPVSTPEEAAELVAQIKSKYYDARHHCYAYRLRNGGQRYADDGEPQGTAGLPILDILERRDLVDCIIIVTRYFGGTLLGTGGLVRSYSAAAADALAHTPLLTMQQYIKGTFSCHYNQQGRLQPLVEQYEGLMEQIDYTEHVTFSFLLPIAQQEPFAAQLRELSYGEIEAIFGDTLSGGSAEGQWFSAT
ncbi:MAG: YigZ family protein [Clostridia bacterium]|nr:YigZ family protein [Clostridia bacterium]